MGCFFSYHSDHLLAPGQGPALGLLRPPPTGFWRRAPAATEAAEPADGAQAALALLSLHSQAPGEEGLVL